MLSQLASFQLHKISRRTLKWRQWISVVYQINTFTQTLCLPYIYMYFYVLFSPLYATDRTIRCVLFFFKYIINIARNYFENTKHPHSIIICFLSFHHGIYIKGLRAMAVQTYDYLFPRMKHFQRSSMYSIKLNIHVMYHLTFNTWKYLQLMI